MQKTGSKIVQILTVLSLALVMTSGANGVRANEIEIGGTGAALGTMRLLLDAYSESHPEVWARCCRVWAVPAGSRRS